MELFCLSCDNNKQKRNNTRHLLAFREEKIINLKQAVLKIKVVVLLKNTSLQGPKLHF